jgi:hypothetical protein
MSKEKVLNVLTADARAAVRTPRESYDRVAVRNESVNGEVGEIVVCLSPQSLPLPVNRFVRRIVPCSSSSVSLIH